MGIVEEVLADFELSTGESYRIEYNIGGVIHVHIDNVRLDFSEEEFEDLVDVVEAGKSQLDSIKNG